MIGPVEEAGVFDFLVFAYAVEAHGLGEEDVADEGVVGRGGLATVLPVALIEDELERPGAAVEDEAIALHGNGAERGVAPDGVEHGAFGVEEFQLDVDDGGLDGAPEEVVAEVVDAGVREGDAPVELS